MALRGGLTDPSSQRLPRAGALTEADSAACCYWACGLAARQACSRWHGQQGGDTVEDMVNGVAECLPRANPGGRDRIRDPSAARCAADVQPDAPHPMSTTTLSTVLIRPSGLRRHVRGLGGTVPERRDRPCPDVAVRGRGSPRDPESRCPARRGGRRRSDLTVEPSVQSQGGHDAGVVRGPPRLGSLDGSVPDDVGLPGAHRPVQEDQVDAGAQLGLGLARVSSGSRSARDRHR